jgi:hypothetical protein
MVSLIVKPPGAQPPYRAGRINSGGFKPALGKGYTRLFQPVRFLVIFGRVVSLTHKGFYPPSTTGRPTDVCLFGAA